MQADNDNISTDILKGASEIAKFLGLSRRAIYHAVDTGVLPTFRIGSNVFARRSTLLAWIASQEQAAA
jgi:excisionase family DNA binding protein